MASSAKRGKKLIKQAEKAGDRIPGEPTDGDDDFFGGNFNELIFGLGGDDRLSGGAGNDNIFGGEGSDILDGGSNDPLPDWDATEVFNLGDFADYRDLGFAVTVSLAEGVATDEQGERDTLTNFEHIRGTEFPDVLIGDAFRNLIVGQGGSDEIRGGGSDDFLAGDAADSRKRGDDRLFGDDGSDFFYVGRGRDFVDGGEGFDIITYDAGIFPQLEKGIKADLSNNEIRVSKKDVATVISIEGIYGSANDDVITGDDNDNDLRGRGGNDQVFGMGGDDTVVGSEGDDRIYGGAGNDRLFGAQGEDRLWGNDGDDQLGAGAVNQLKGRFYFEYTQADVSEGNDTIINFREGADIIIFEFNDLVIGGRRGSDLKGQDIFELLDSNFDRRLDDGDDFVSTNSFSVRIDTGGFLASFGIEGSTDVLTVADASELVARDFG